MRLEQEQDQDRPAAAGAARPAWLARAAVDRDRTGTDRPYPNGGADILGRSSKGAARRYVTAFAGARDSYQVPLALAQSQQLDCLVTDLYLPPLPQIVTRFMKIGRRSAPGLSVLDTRFSPGVFWQSNVSWRFAKNRVGQQHLSYKLSQDALSRQAGERAFRKGCDLFLYAGYALEAFKDPRLRSARRILFMYHPHITRSSEILLEDVARYPDAQSTVASLAVDSRDRDVDQELALADLIVCASEFTASTVRAIGVPSRKIAVVPYGIDVSGTYSPRKSSDFCHFLFVGTGIHRKGLHILFDAWKQARLPEAKLTVVSRYVDPWIRARADGPGMTIRNGVGREELEALYEDANVFVLPSLIEGFGYVYLEALARGCLCIGTTNTGLPDLKLSDEEAMTIAPGSRDALAVALTNAHALWKSKKIDPARIRRQVSSWSWARFRASISDLAYRLEVTPEWRAG